MSNLRIQDHWDFFYLISLIFGECSRVHKKGQKKHSFTTWLCGPEKDIQVLGASFFHLSMELITVLVLEGSGQHRVYLSLFQL